MFVYAMRRDGNTLLAQEILETLARFGAETVLLDEGTNVTNPSIVPIYLRDKAMPDDVFLLVEQSGKGALLPTWAPEAPFAVVINGERVTLPFFKEKTNRSSFEALLHAVYATNQRRPGDSSNDTEALAPVE
jgi:hypothetical protein